MWYLIFILISLRFIFPPFSLAVFLSLHPQLILGQWTNLVCTNLFLCDLFVSTKSYPHHLTTFLSVCLNYPRFKKQDTELTPSTNFLYITKALNQSFLIGNFLLFISLFLHFKNPPGNCVTSAGRSCWDESSWHWIAINYYNDTHFSCDGHHTPSYVETLLPLVKLRWLGLWSW